MLKLIPMQEYRNADGLSNSDLQIFKNNPSSYVWVKNAPSDPLKETTSDVGTATHTMLLEPHLFDDSVIVTDIKGRITKGFEALQREHSDKIVLTEIEAEQIKIMSISAKCDPMINFILNSKGPCEASIFVTDPITDLELKIRPDKISIDNTGRITPVDVKTTASLDEWRSDVKWKNPLFNFGYGFTAAYYLYVASIHYGVELDEYCFLVVQKSASLGKYPASTFTISKDELIHYGFWQDMLDTLQYFKYCQDNNLWTTKENFPEFYVEGDEVFDLDKVEVVNA